MENVKYHNCPKIRILENLITLQVIVILNIRKKTRLYKKLIHQPNKSNNFIIIQPAAV